MIAYQLCSLWYSQPRTYFQSPSLTIAGLSLPPRSIDPPHKPPPLRGFGERASEMLPWHVGARALAWFWLVGGDAVPVKERLQALPLSFAGVWAPRGVLVQADACLVWAVAAV